MGRWGRHPSRVGPDVLTSKHTVAGRDVVPNVPDLSAALALGRFMGHLVQRWSAVTRWVFR
jgi:hypothetical protein